ncbi:MAG: AAA domain-containing protein [Desulfobulbaceae bacterium]|nr:AAA domain-containing protein [Desulfobulbaceae bacterium]
MVMKQIPPEKTQVKITNDHGEDHNYVFEPDAINAINAALTINRPLLVRGEPGVGKSQLAKAAAMALQRTYIPFVINASTEPQDLLWSFDAVARLADAQIEGALCQSENERAQARENLALHRYLKPAPLWAALNWQSAEDQYKNTHNPKDCPLPHYLNADKASSNGVVVLIDEIDKADSSVPNGLLEVLGANRFHPQGMDKAVEAEKNGVKPLVIITTNEERILPDAFIRRCLSVTLGLPKGRKNQIDYLVGHAGPSFVELSSKTLIDGSKQTLLAAVAEQVLDDRNEADKNNLHPLPGQAEYFDLLRGLQARMQETSDNKIQQLIETLARFTSKKHPDFPAKEGQKHP